MGKETNKTESAIFAKGISLTINSKLRYKSGFDIPDFVNQPIIPVDKFTDVKGNEFFKAEAVLTKKGNSFQPIIYTGEVIAAHETVSKNGYNVPLFTEDNKIDPRNKFSYNKEGLSVTMG